MSDSASPAAKFLEAQHLARTHVRNQFRDDAGGFLDAHQFALSAIAQCLDRIAGQRWQDTLDATEVERLTMLAQQSALFIHGIDPCEVAIAEGLYGQAASLVRQHMEILAATREILNGSRRRGRTPNVRNLPDAMRPHYGGLSELAHASVPEYLNAYLTHSRGERIGASLAPTYNKELALFLYRIELGLMIHMAEHIGDSLSIAYGDGFTPEELALFRLAVDAGNRAAEVLGEIPGN